jgi:hypothetical protein
MKISRRTTLFATLPLAAVLALGGCNKQGEPGNAPAPSASSAAPGGAAQPPSEAGQPSGVNGAPAPAAVSVANVQLGNAVGADQNVTAPGTSFAPTDTIYAAVATTGSGTATLAAKWTYQDGQTVHEESKSIEPTGPATTTFQINKPSGWPAGNYKVEISMNGQPVSSKEFTVK